MAIVRRVLVALPVLPVAGGVFLATQVLRAAHRSDLPSFPNQDPSGVFGDPGAPPLRVVALGDSSITAPGVMELDNTWIRRVVRHHAVDHHVELISLAVGGSKARDVIEGQLTEAVRLRPDVAVVSVGANDAMRGVSTRRFRRDLVEIVDRLEPVTGAIVVLGVGDLGSIPRLPAVLRPYLTNRAAVFDHIARDVTLSRPRAVKVYTGGRISTAFHEDTSLFADDLFHAGDTGHAVFAEEAQPAVDAAIAAAVVRRSRSG